jgi:hypothetical protein
MIKIVLTPEWFLGKDVLIDFFSFFVLLAFFILCLKSYKINKKNGFKYLGWGFLIISAGQLAAILTKLVLYYDTVFTQQIGQMIITQHIVNSVDIFYYTGFFFNKFLTLLGLFIIYKIPEKEKRPIDFIIAAYFIILSALVGSDIYYIYHLSVVLFLVLIIGNYYSVWKANKNQNTRMLVISFTILAAGHFLFLMSKIGILFVLGNIIELASYIILLYLMIRILRSGKN